MNVFSSLALFRWFGARLIRLFAVVFVVSVLTFVMLDLLPGDVSHEIAGENATAEDVKAIREELGLDRPLVARYAEWLTRTVSGDMGRSHRTGENVRDAILSHLPVTLELMVLAPVLALLFAIPAALVSACRARSRLDRWISAMAFAGMSVPGFVMALLLIYAFSLHFHWLPATGFTPLSEGPAANLRSVALPVVSLALVEWVPFMRVLRSDLISTLQEDYILMARAKGLSSLRILLVHALPPSLFTLITVLGLHLGHLIGGAVVIEWIFALPGMGRLLIIAIFARDAMLVQGCVLFITIGYVLIHFCVDFLYLLLDPRLRPGIGWKPA